MSHCRASQSSAPSPEFVSSAIALASRTGRIALALAALLVGARLGRAAEPPVVPQLAAARLLASGQHVRIVSFGDSLTGVYYHSGGRRGWCDLLGIALKRIYPGADPEMINAGISGNTAAQGLKRIDRDVLSRHPQLVVVMFCLNDVVVDTPAHFHDNLTEIVRRIRGVGSEVVLMTPNSIYYDAARRPMWKVSAYVEIVRQVARESAVPLADCFRSFEDIRAVSREAWVHLMSETVHPNMRGQKIFAEEAAWAISGHRISLDELPPNRPGLPPVIAKLRAHQPVKIVAMKPFDALIGPALQSLYPDAKVDVTPWDARNKSLADLVAATRTKSYRGTDAPGDPDLIVLAVPPDDLAADGDQFYFSYSMIINGSLPFGKTAGKEGWNCVAILPSVLQPELNQGQRAAELLALEVVRDKDIDYLVRAPGDAASPQDLLARWLKSLLEPGSPG